MNVPVIVQTAPLMMNQLKVQENSKILLFFLMSHESSLNGYLHLGSGHSNYKHVNPELFPTAGTIAQWAT